MTRATVLAFAAGGCGVLGAWEALAAAEGVRLSGFARRVLAPLVRAATEGRLPSAPERRRLALLVAGSLLAAGWLLGGPVLGAFAALGGPAAAVGLVRARRARYTAGLRRGAAPAARALAALLSAGRSVRGALAEAGRDLDGPAGHELRVAGRALAVGDRTDDVLERLRLRAGAPAWDSIVAAVLLQRDAGGDLAALLRELATSLEAADRIERDARTATAQSRFTAWIVLALPLAAAVLAELASPGFVSGLAAEPLSAALAVAALTLQAVAGLLIRRIARPPA